MKLNFPGGIRSIKDVPNGGIFFYQDNGPPLIYLKAYFESETTRSDWIVCLNPHTPWHNGLRCPALIDPRYFLYKAALYIEDAILIPDVELSSWPTSGQHEAGYGDLKIANSTPFLWVLDMRIWGRVAVNMLTGRIGYDMDDAPAIILSKWSIEYRLFDAPINVLTYPYPE